MKSGTAVLSILVWGMSMTYAQASAYNAPMHSSSSSSGNSTSTGVTVATSQDLKFSGDTCPFYPASYPKGTTYKVVTKIEESGGREYTEENDSEVLGPTTFRGQKAIAIRENIELAYPSHKNVSIIDHFYGVGAQFVYLYGARVRSGGETYNDPPISLPRCFVMNTPYTETDTMHTLATDGVEDRVTSQTTRVLLGIESVTVPAGTFQAYKVGSETSLGSNGMKTGRTYSWVVASGRFAGFVIKNTFVRPASAQGSSTAFHMTRTALSVQLNGK
ncbi:MAG TPA: hypothetical protein VFR20_09580 [Burkholderiaceae bacterium]|nr:hypothetical protein [Burkholderiaceae bacterium]